MSTSFSDSPANLPHHPERKAALEALRQLVTEMAGRKLPGERELAQRLTISRQHLRTLLDQLESEGLVERRQGSGTYAVDELDNEISHVGLMIDARLKLGNDPFFSLLTERIQLGLQAAGIHCYVERIDGTSRPRFLGDGVIFLGMAGVAAISLLTPNDPPAVLLAEASLALSLPGPRFTITAGRSRSRYRGGAAGDTGRMSASAFLWSGKPVRLSWSLGGSSGGCRRFQHTGASNNRGIGTMRHELRRGPCGSLRSRRATAR